MFLAPCLCPVVCKVTHTVIWFIVSIQVYLWDFFFEGLVPGGGVHSVNALVILANNLGLIYFQ